MTPNPVVTRVVRRFFPRFDNPEFEARYRASHLEQALPSVRRALVVSILIESAFTITDVALNLDRPWVWKKLLLMRFLVWLPLLLAPMVASYFEWGRRHLVALLGGMVVIYGCSRGVTTFSTLPPDLQQDTLFALLMVVVLHSFILGLPIRVLYFTGAGLSIGYSLIAASVGLQPQFVFMHTFVALVLGGACLFGAHQLEMAERRHFAANEDLTVRNQQFEAALEQLRAAQADLVRAERMASVATLVRGIAHELNNPIGFIAGNVPHLRKYCEFLSRAATGLADGETKSPEALRALTHFSEKKDLAYVVSDLSKMMSDIAEGARRTTLIIRDLQALTPTGKRALENVDLHRVVAQTVALLKPRVPPGVELVPELQAGASEVVEARAGELEQVLVNLVDNAIRAVGERGTIRVRVAREAHDIVVSVVDDGPGMPPEVQKRALEPFFSTRPPGEGSGLGLAIAASIAREHQGSLALQSEVGWGTQATLRLPVKLARPALPAAAS